MAGFNTGGGGGWAPGGGSPGLPFHWPGSNEPTVNTSSSGQEVTIGLPSPLGDKIPQGIGTFPVYGRLIVDPNLLGGVTQGSTTSKVTLVLGFCETTLGGNVELINLKANDEYIYRTETPTKSYSGTMRFYGGDQTALDPLLEDKLDNPTYWPRLAYIVLQDFDIAPYDNQLPNFQAELSTVASASALSVEEATLTFGPEHDGSAALENAWDRVRNHIYRSDFDNANGKVYILTFDVVTNMEINRAEITWSGGAIDYTGWWVSLEGSDYIAAVLQDTVDGIFKLALINVVTGVVEATLDPKYRASTPAECTPVASQLIVSDAATKYLLYSDSAGDLVDESSLVVTVCDVTNHTLTDIVHPYTNPAVEDGRNSMLGVANGPAFDGQAIMFYVLSTGNNAGTVWKLVLTESNLVSATEVFTGTNCRDLAYDFTDNTIVVYYNNTFLSKVDSAGTTLYTVNTGVTGLWMNFGAYQTGGMFHYKCREGFAAAEVVFGSHDVYLIDLSNGSISLIIDGDDYWNGYVTYDQTTGFLTTDSLTDTLTGVRRYTLPLSTVGTIDLTTIYTKLAEYRGKFSSSDLEFDGFTGAECYGVVYESDTTMDNAEQDANNIFDVKIVPSDGKRKYVKAKRDGSFVIDAVLDTGPGGAVVEQGEFNITKSMLSDEQTLVGARINYYDKNARFKRTDQEYRRPVGIYSVTRSDRMEDVSTNFVLSASQAIQAITTKVYRSNLGMDIYSFTLGPEKFYLEPADIVQFDFEGFTVVGQINEANLSGEMFTQDVTVTQYLQAIDASYVGSGINVPSITNPSWLTRFLYLDAPLLSAGDDLSGAAFRQYAMLSGYGYGDFQGATLYRSYDGNTYNVVTSRYSVSPVIGVVKALTGTRDATVEDIDHTSTLEVTLLSGDETDVATITEAQMLAGNNKALLGKEGRWVVIYFQTVSISNKVATLSDIIWSSPFYQDFLDQLAVGDYFVFLQPGHHVRFSGEISRLGDEIFYKAASDAFDISQVATEKHTLNGVAEKPFPPLHLNAVVNGSDIDITWDWRSRLNTSPLPGSDNSSAGETALAFEIDIMDGATVKRTLTATTNSKTYLDADITTDFGSIPTEFTFHVYQMSSLVGRGYVAEKTVEFQVVEGVGSAAGSATASAVGQALSSEAAGSAAGSSSVSGVGAYTLGAVGSAAGSSTVTGVGPEYILLADSAQQNGSGTPVTRQLGTPASDRVLAIAVVTRNTSSVVHGISSMTLDGTEVPIVGVSNRINGTASEKVFWGIIPWPSGTTGSLSITYNSSFPGNTQARVFIHAVYGRGEYGYVGGEREETQDPSVSALAWASSANIAALSHAFDVDVTWGADMTETADVYNSGASRRFSAAKRVSTADETITVSANPADTQTSQILSLLTMRQTNHPSMVGRSRLTYVTATSTSVAIPIDAREDDLLLAVVFHRSTLTPPAGWTLVDMATCNALSTNQFTSVYQRAAQSGDANASTTWSQSASGRMAAQIVAFRSTDGILEVLDSATANQDADTTDSNIMTNAVVAATSDGQAVLNTGSLLAAATSPTATSLTPSSGFIQLGYPSIVDNRLAVTWMPIDNGEDSTGTITASTLGTAENGWAAVAVLIGVPGNIGSASGSASASGVGASIATAVGSASGQATVSAVSSSVGEAVGSAAGSSAASAVGQAVSGGDPHWANVVLLISFDGTDTATAAKDDSNSAHTLTFVGNAQLDTAQQKFGTSSLLLDGSGDRVTAADSADWQLGASSTDPWTFELWARFNTITAGNRGIIGQNSGSGWTLFLDATLTNLTLAASSFSDITTSSAGLTTGVWYHIAVDHDSSGKIRIYVDGVMRGSATPANSGIVDSSVGLAIGARDTAGTQDMNGWIDELRITKGVARYASDSGFTVPTEAYPRHDPNFADVKLLLGFDGVDGATSTTDDSPSAHSITFNGDAQIDTAQSKFGGSSLRLDGTGDYLTIPDSDDWQLGATNSDPWTVECWVRWNTLTSADRGILGQDTGSGWTLTGSSSTIGEVAFVSANIGSVETTGASMTTGVWYHIAVDHDASGKVRIYVDGVMRGSSTPANSAIPTSSLALGVGAQDNVGTVSMDGWLDEIRITKGVARYASDSGFIVPTAAFPRS